MSCFYAKVTRRSNAGIRMKMTKSMCSQPLRKSLGPVGTRGLYDRRWAGFSSLDKIMDGNHY